MLVLSDPGIAGGFSRSKPQPPQAEQLGSPIGERRKRDGIGITSATGFFAIGGEMVGDEGFATDDGTVGEMPNPAALDLGDGQAALFFYDLLKLFLGKGALTGTSFGADAK